jgi:hypothetical protein
MPSSAYAKMPTFRRRKRNRCLKYFFIMFEV